MDLALVEYVAVFFGLLSVFLERYNKVALYPTGLISSLLFVYLTFYYDLLGDTIISGYYVIMGVYGWYYWTRKKAITQISYTTPREKRVVLYLFLVTLIAIPFIYFLFNKWNSWVSAIDTLTTSLFFTGMWLMAKRKIENWLFWIVGNAISIPLYFYKGLSVTSFQYLVFTAIAVWGYFSWIKYYERQQTT